MGFYIRKSVSVGPFRFNLSKSGVGISTGVKGLRFGTGPRGNYVHMGRAGLYYRATLPSAPQRVVMDRQNLQQQPTAGDATHDPLLPIESADVSQLVDSSSHDLLAELNEKRKKFRFWPAIPFPVLVFFGYGIYQDWGAGMLTMILVFGIALTVLIAKRDTVRKTTVIMYDFDPEMEHLYGNLHAAAEALAQSSAMWHIESIGRVRNQKYHAGAANLLSRKRTGITKAEPPYLKTNVDTVAIAVGRQVLHFFPDRLLVYTAEGVGAVSYQNLDISVSGTRFIEEDRLPKDARVVDHTWKYVNKSGGPDKRFNNNRQLPICMYDELTLSSSSGLKEVVQISNLGITQAFVDAVRLAGTSVVP